MWLARATPRAWLTEGEVIRIENAPCSIGRVSYVLRSEIDSAKCITANVSLTPHKFAAHKSASIVGSTSSTGGGGGVVLRLRTPGKRTIASVHTAGVALPPARWNVSDETITFAEGAQMAQLISAPLRVCYS